MDSQTGTLYTAAQTYYSHSISRRSVSSIKMNSPRAWLRDH